MSRLLTIAGPSCSGKSTVARLLAAETGATLLHLDAYWRKGCERPLVNGAPSHERPEQYDGAALAGDIAALREAFPDALVIAEGFLLFCYPDILALSGVPVFIGLAPEELHARRVARSEQAGDASRGGKRAAVEASWQANGLDEWRRFGAAQADLPGMNQMDGKRSPEELAGLIAGIWWWANND